MANEAPCQQVDIYTRSDFVGLIKEDRSNLGCLIIGQTGIVNASDDDERWQIRRVTNVAGVITTQYANNAKYNLKWSDRTTYFPACPPGALPIPGDFPQSPCDGSQFVTPQGLCVDARFREVIVTDTWTPLAATPFTRNVLAVQHRWIAQPDDVKINWPPDVITPVGYVGMLMRVGEERQYDIKDSLTPYARVDTGLGPVTLFVEEID